MAHSHGGGGGGGGGGGEEEEEEEEEGEEEEEEEEEGKGQRGSRRVDNFTLGKEWWGKPRGCGQKGWPGVTNRSRG